MCGVEPLASNRCLARAWGLGGGASDTRRETRASFIIRIVASSMLALPMWKGSRVWRRNPHRHHHTHVLIHTLPDFPPVHFQLIFGNVTHIQLTVLDIEAGI
jgi:hypothetical protein